MEVSDVAKWQTVAEVAKRPNCAPLCAALAYVSVLVGVHGLSNMTILGAMTHSIVLDTFPAMLLVMEMLGRLAELSLLSHKLSRGGSNME